VQRTRTPEPDAHTRPRWPVHFGIASLGFAALTLLFTIAWLTVPVWNDTFADAHPGVEPPPFMVVGQGWIAIGAGLLLTTALLTAAGLLTVQRRIIGRRLHQLYGLVATAVTIGLMLHVSSKVERTGEWASTNGDIALAERFSELSRGNVFGVGIPAVSVILLLWPACSFIRFYQKPSADAWDPPERGVETPDEAGERGLSSA